MPLRTRVVRPGIDQRSVRTAEGEILRPPDDWEKLIPGDATLTRRVKQGGPTWTVQVKVRKRMMSSGVWAPAARIAEVRAALEAERATPAYARKKAQALARREKAQGAYVEDFQGAVLAFLAFAPAHRALAERVAAAVSAHATPVGSGTVARTQRIPIERRAEAAVIAWLRHQTTAYDDMKVPRVKGARRELRRQLAQRSRALLLRYRSGLPVPAADCPLHRALAGGA
jgi:hypothetical protein